ncbi:dephospho-CoA kinase [Sphingosinicella microcystinivorans]|uniref:Dephospho-CoA kinase n=1 Tax=Sphingosinicella microcystinivorans TaxID=335406 RepID=A0AAD1D3R2_SPHMI|nr:dephospho-CoA kinase [Sphingosinicella microcystinivorans]
MIVLGLTGSIGMGKSTVAAMLRRAGVPVFDADAEVHRLQGPGGAAIEAIEAAFPGTTGPKGVDRPKLGAAVFGNTEARRRLEKIVHPLVREAQQAFLAEARQNRAAIVALDIPLLFEGGGHAHVDATIVVSAPAHVQRRRVLARPGMSHEKFAAILATQMRDREKRRRADFVIDTGQSLRETRAEIRHLVSCLRRHGVRYCKSCVKSSSTPRRRVSTRRTGIASAKSVASSSWAGSKRGARSTRT